MPLRHKHLKLDQRLIDRARRAFRARTEQEAVTRALELALSEEPALRALRRARGIGGIDDVFGHA